MGHHVPQLHGLLIWEQSFDCPSLRVLILVQLTQILHFTNCVEAPFGCHLTKLINTACLVKLLKVVVSIALKPTIGI